MKSMISGLMLFIFSYVSSTAFAQIADGRALASRQNPPDPHTRSCVAQCELWKFEGQGAEDYRANPGMLAEAQHQKIISDISVVGTRRGGGAAVAVTLPHRINSCWTDVHRTLLRNVAQAHGMNARNWCAMNLIGYYADGPNQALKRIVFEHNNFHTVD